MPAHFDAIKKIYNRHNGEVDLWDACQLRNSLFHAEPLILVWHASRVMDHRPGSNLETGRVGEEKNWQKLCLTINRPAGQIGRAWRQKHQRLRMILAVMFGMLQFFQRKETNCIVEPDSVSGFFPLLTAIFHKSQRKPIMLTTVGGMLWQKEVILVKQHLTICQKIQQRRDDSQILSTSESIPQNWDGSLNLYQYKLWTWNKPSMKLKNWHFFKTLVDVAETLWW